MDFQKLADSFFAPTCIISVEKRDDGWGTIRLVAGNSKYIEPIEHPASPDILDIPGVPDVLRTVKRFVPNSPYDHYLPEDIVLTMGGVSTKNYTYDSYTGVITIPTVTGNINIVAAALSRPKVRRPSVVLSGSVLTIESTRYAEVTKTYIDGTLKYTDTEA